MGEGDLVSARALATQATGALDRALEVPQYLPVDTDLIEDAISAQINGSAEPREFLELSTLVPMLATASAFMADEETLPSCGVCVSINAQGFVGAVVAGLRFSRPLAATGKALSDIGVSRFFRRFG